MYISSNEYHASFIKVVSKFTENNTLLLKIVIFLLLYRLLYDIVYPANGLQDFARAYALFRLNFSLLFSIDVAKFS